MSHTRSRAMVCAMVAVLSAPPVAAAQDALWRTVDMSRQLHDTLPQRIRVQYGAGRVDVRGSSDPLLYAMHLRYDERRAIPLHRYDAEQRAAMLGVQSREGGIRNASRDDDEGELRLTLPQSIPLDLAFDLGGTRTSLDLGGLALQSLRLQCGATDATLLFTSPNRVRMAEMEIDVGAADFYARLLGNANADQIRVRGGVGLVDLDFGGIWSRDVSLNAQLAVGKLVLRVPPEVGVRIEVQRLAAGFSHDGFVKRGNAWYSENWDSAAHKLTVSAQTVFGKIDVQRGTR